MGKGRRTRAFTLVELLIVVIIIAILAAIAIPKFINSQQRAYESFARGEIRLARDALSRFNSDTGMWPINLDDMAGTNAPAQALNGGGNAKNLDPTTYKGPYITAPVIPTGYSNWIQYTFSPSTKGVISCPQTGTDSSGTPYANY